MYSEIYSILIGLVGLEEASYFGYIFAEFLAVFLTSFFVLLPFVFMFSLLWRFTK